MRNGIKYKLISYFSVMMAIIILLVGSSSYFLTYKMTEEMLIKEFYETNEFNKTSLDRFIIKNQLAIESLSRSKEVSDFIYGEKKDVERLLINLTKINEEIVTAYVSDEKGNFISSEKEDLIERMEKTNEDWYKNAKESKNIYFSDIKKDKKSGEGIITLSFPVLINGDVEGVVGADIKVKYINKLFGKNNYDYIDTFLIDSNDHIIFSSEYKYYDKNINDSLNKYENYIINYKRIGISDWNLISVFDKKSIYEESKDVLIIIAFVFILIILISTTILILILKLINPLFEINDELLSIRSGDLSLNYNRNVNNDFDKLYGGINYLISHLKYYVDNMREVSIRMKENSIEIKTSNNLNKEIIEVIEKDTENINNNVEELSDLVDDSVKVIENLSEKINKINQDNLLISENLLLVNKNIERGNNKLSIINNSNVENELMLKELINKMGNLKNLSKNLENKVEKISNINNRINILSVTSAIEISRNGLYEVDFEVVADEIRKLSNKSDVYIEEIEKLIIEIDQYNEKSIQSAYDVKSKCIDTSNLVKQFQESFNDSYEKINFVNNKIDDINKNIDDVVNDKDSIYKNHMEALNVVKDNRKLVNGIVESINKQKLILDKFSEVSKELEIISDEIIDETNKFKKEG